MKVRDTRKYIEDLCGTSSLEQLGTDEDTLLCTMYGLEQKLDAAITESSNFANNAEEQLFYEFVQNAFDAKADSLMFFANEKYLIILNNGLPFYTDYKIKGAEVREGQLYNFLAKGKSRKYGDDSLMGQYGQGSKLMYTLLMDVSGKKSKDLLLDTIKVQKKGPYLISWNSRDQLEELLLNRGIWDYVDPSDEKNGILVTKIVMSYYPILPGIDQSLFSDKEMSDAIAAFDELVNPRRNINKLKQGTALIVPLGRGKFKIINDEANLENVKVRLAGFASVVAGKTKFHGSKLNYISVMGSEVEKIDSTRINVKFNLDGDDFSFDFAFNPKFSADESVNFYNALPILDTKYGLGFIVDSQQFELEGSRQRLQDKNKTSLHIRTAFEELVSTLRKLKISDPKKFDFIYTSILDTHIPDGVDFDFIRNPFMEVIKPFLCENVRTAEGDYVKIENVRYKDQRLKKLDVSLSTLGIKDYRWVSDDIRQKYHEHLNCDFKDKQWSYQKLVDLSDKTFLASWLQSLSESEYESAHDLASGIVKDNTYSPYANIGLFRTSKGRIVSYNDIIKGKTTFLTNNIVTPATLAAIDDLEYVKNPSFNEVSGIQLEYIKENVSFFAKSFLHKEKACLILSLLENANSNLRDKIKKIPLLENRQGRKMPFEDLFLQRPENTILYDEFIVKGALPQHAKKEWFVNSDKDVWIWTKRNLDKIKSLRDWRELAITYLNDIKQSFNKAVPGAGVLQDEDRIDLYLDNYGVPTNEKYCIIDYSNITDEAYHGLTEIFSSEQFISNRFRKILQRPPFSTNRVKIEDLISDGMTVTEAQLVLMSRTSTRFINKYWIEKESYDRYIFHKLADGHNFIFNGEINEECMHILTNASYFRLPMCIIRYIHETDKNKLSLQDNPSLMIDIINKTYNPIGFLPLVIPCNQNVHKEYLSCLAAINITGKISQDSLQWRVIVFAAEHSYQDLMFRKITYKNCPLPTSIYDNVIEYNGHLYDIFKLLPAEASNDRLATEFFKCLPDSWFFRKKYYANQTKKMQPSEVYDKLYGEPLDVEQLHFALDYIIKESKSDSSSVKSWAIELADSSLLYDALQMIGKYRLLGFDKYFIIPGYKKTQIYCSDELLLEEEKLPNILKVWLDENNTAHLMTTLSKGDSYIKFRQALLENVTAPIIDFKSDKDKLNRTIKWIYSKKFDIEYNSNRFLGIEWMIKSYSNDNPPQYYFLRYTGELSVASDPQPLFCFEPFSTPSFFLGDYDWKTSLVERLKDSNIKQFFHSKKVYYATSKLLIQELGLDVGSSVQVSDASESSRSYSEWNNPTYQKWKGLKEAEGIHIYISNQQIPILFTIIPDGSKKPVFCYKLHSKDYGYNQKEKSVIIKYPNDDGLNEIRTLAKYSTKIDFFKSPFIKLQSMFLEPLDSIIKVAEDKGITIDEIIKKVTTDAFISSDADKQLIDSFKDFDDKTKAKLIENADAVKSLIINCDGEDIRYIAENIDELKEILEEKLDAEEEKESHVRQTIGYIGELIYVKYLQDKLGKNIDHASERGVGEYDVLNISDNVYVDVKTTLYSLKDGTAPFYLHCSQNVFMQKNPDAKYRIVRISLNDLNLEQSYKEIRDHYGTETDPRQDSNLRKACMKLAERYWRSAQIEEFESSVPQYMIRIEKSYD